MHPTDETLAARLNGRPDPALESHLASCADCARRLEGMAAWNRELSGAFGEELRLPAADRGMRAALPRPPVRWRWAAAAAVILAAGGGFHLRNRNAQTEASKPNGTVLRLESSASGAELLAAPGARLARKGDGWELLSGACLATAPARVSVGSRTVAVLEGEAVIRILPERASASLLRDAWASEAPFEVAVLSGRVEMTGSLRADAGHVLGSDGSLRALKDGDRTFLARAASGIRLLENRSSWTETPPDAYLVSVRLRMKDSKSLAALVYEISGRPSFWIPEGLRADGAWHELSARVTPSWIVLSLDSIPVHRAQRKGFQPNPAAEVPGAGLAVWDGAVEAEGLRVILLQ